MYLGVHQPGCYFGNIGKARADWLMVGFISQSEGRDYIQLQLPCWEIEGLVLLKKDLLDESSQRMQKCTFCIV